MHISSLSKPKCKCGVIFLFCMCYLLFVKSVHVYLKLIKKKLKKKQNV